MFLILLKKKQTSLFFFFSINIEMLKGYVLKIGTIISEFTSFKSV